jgi:hypothetical protein
MWDSNTLTLAAPTEREREVCMHEDREIFQSCAYLPSSFCLHAVKVERAGSAERGNSSSLSFPSPVIPLASRVAPLGVCSTFHDKFSLKILATAATNHVWLVARPTSSPAQKTHTSKQRAAASTFRGTIIPYDSIFS